MSYNKPLQDLWEKINDIESRDLVSPKPFTPSALHVILSHYAPQYYTQEQITQLQNFYEQQLKTETVEDNKFVPTTTYQTEHIIEEETVKQISKKSKKRIVKNSTTPSPPPPSLPDQFVERIRELNGSDIKFLMEKELFETDVKRNNNRLSMPESKIECEFLSEEEKETLYEREGRQLHGMEVSVLDPCLREFTLSLKKWDMKTYNLVTNWHNVVAINNMQQGHKFHIWSFRVDAKLYILLNKP
ncbi:hypothetical protein Lal_00026530 [Lupinus albus]|uniref:Putative B3 domain-containing protein n=1 Tax=Lupinus albus TaxID=3870 RepID=A0A6A5LQE4_LUPAL|nr:putative B3 domain-containing protein [Lupinus albus]KAF1862013.1 hypothetical protein Lal_00026530 [Lupinus albus]